ncbi:MULTISPECIES: hypothetical protein [Pseudomonas]|nr:MULTISPECIES: hypothetical protein [Pseudomonas]
MVDAVSRMLGMSRGQRGLEQADAQGADQKKGDIDPEMLKKLLELLSRGPQGAGGSSGSNSGGGEGESYTDKLDRLMGKRDGLAAMMPGDDNGRKINV